MRQRVLSLSVLALFLAAFAVAQTVPPDDQQTEDDWIAMRAELGDSHASGMRPELGPMSLGNPTQSVVVMRVGLCYSYTSSGTYSEFYSVNHPSADISSTVGDVHVIDESTGKQIIDIEPPAIVHVANDGSGYQVSVDGVFLGTFDGPIFFRPTDATNQFRVESIRRTFIGTVAPLYHGAIEIARGRTTAAGKVNVVNVVELEDYVAGVVVNESLSSFAPEALKAQAVAARGYAVSNVGGWVGKGYPFDVVDSSSSQVYRGVMSETSKALQAATETAGLVASSSGKIISAMYSSSFGGHSEDNEWIFPYPSNQLPGTNATSYLRGIYDGDGTIPDFSSDAGIADFWTKVQLSIFDDCKRVGNRFSRWQLILKPADIKSRLTSGRYVIISGTISGAVTDVKITQRMTASARAAIAQITLTTGVVEVRGWDNLRNVLGRTAVSTPAMCVASAISANFTLNNPSYVVKNADGSFTFSGGGWGHNLGMSQYGANGRAKSGQTFIEILKAYYTGVDIGSYPIDIGRQPGSGPPTLRQQFFAPNARGTLVIRATDLKKLVVHVNDLVDLSFDEATLAAGPVAVDISPYLITGVNTVQYNPVGRDGTATVNVVVE